MGLLAHAVACRCGEGGRLQKQSAGSGIVPCGAADTGRESPEAAVCLTCAEVTGADRCDRGFPRHRHR